MSSGVWKKGDFIKKLALQGNYIVTKHNDLNEFRPKDMRLQELRFLVIYLSKINPKDVSTRLVRFPLSDFQEIMGLGRLNVPHFKNAVNRLLTRLTSVPDEKGTGMVVFQLFKECKISTDEDGEWYVEIDAHDRALPLMFSLRGRYFKYALWNTLNLGSKNHFRMYEILKQHEWSGSKIISVDELKGQLGLSRKEYEKFNDFQRYVLVPCKKALDKSTDISYEYEIHSRKGRGGKVQELKFTITKNKNYIDLASYAHPIDAAHDKTHDKTVIAGDSGFDFSNLGRRNIITPNSGIDLSDTDEDGIVRSTGNSWIFEEHIDYLMGACSNEFSREEIIVLYGIMQEKIPYIHQDLDRSHDYLQKKHRELNMRSKQNKITYRFAYFKRIVEAGED